MESDERIRAAVINTQIIRAPKQSLATFGVTNIYYYLVAEAAYNELINGNETVIREGRVIAERPRIVTPYYLSRVEGFSAEARKYFEMLMERYDPHSPGLYYAYRNEPKELNIVSDSLSAVVAKLNEEIDRKGDPLVSIIKGEDLLWDVSILKFIYELTERSVRENFFQLSQRGLLNIDASGVPSDARLRIEGMFQLVERGEIEPADLKTELDRWGVFEEYQDRFFALFKRKR
ncbi:MAG: hypothetical protein NUV31_00515 [Dehalococcoidales bacterium]|jgi:hypothetical protein|nr:hypothetical protein [Dehalococcoidales bacterium]